MIVKSVIVFMIVVCAGSTLAQDEKPKEVTKKAGGPVSFGKQVFPIVKKNCLPCHAEDSFNPSELSMDSYDQLMSGGKHGVPVVPGKSKESILIQKLGPKPPFGDQMPLHKKKKGGEPPRKTLSMEEINIIAEWIDQGAKKN